MSNISNKLVSKIWNNSKGFWSGLLATVLGIALTVGTAAYQEKKEKEQMKHDITVAVLADFYNFQYKLNQEDSLAYYTIAIHRSMIKRLNPETHKIETSGATEDDFVAFVNNFLEYSSEENSMSKSSFFKDAKILEVLGNVELLNAINECFDYYQLYKQNKMEIIEVQKTLMEPYIYRSMKGLAIDEKLIVSTLESPEYSKYFTKYNEYVQRINQCKSLIKYNIEKACQLSGISLQEVIDLSKKIENEHEVEIPYLNFPIYGLSVPLSSEVTYVQFRNGEIHNAADWKCASVADKDTIDIIGTTLLNNGYTVTIDTVFQADALRKVARSMATNYWKYYSNECQIKKEFEFDMITQAESHHYFEQNEDAKQEMNYMACMHGCLLNEYNEVHTQKYRVYGVIYLPYIDRYVSLHLDGTIFTGRKMFEYFKSFGANYKDRDVFSATALPEKQRIKNSQNYQWMIVMMKEKDAQTPADSLRGNKDYDAVFKKSWEKAMK